MLESIIAFLQTPLGLICQFILSLIVFLRSIYGFFSNTLMLGYLRMGNGLVGVVYLVLSLISGYYVYSLLLPVLAIIRGFLNS